ncbi:uncharacterized protein LOC141595633 [Silene latifolia]|uniref:uncharacterized protein LOC141595633 n=1 Tax=Silene latifolia TaxID=37657 RepID=UPI003D76EE8A
MEALSCNLLQAQGDGSLKGNSLCRGEDALSHLFFADDAVFFLHDRNNSMRVLRVILKKYCKVSGHVMNEDKSGILFSPSMTLAKARCGLRTLKIKDNKGLGKYLGLPTDVQGSKRELFKGIIDIVMKRISSWNGIFLLPAGRLTLISSVLSNISIFFLSVFKIPAMLGKHAWRILSGDHSYFAHVFRKKLLANEVMVENMMNQNGRNLSWGARSVLHGLQFVRQHIGWKPGLESELNIWTNKWVSGMCPEPSEMLLGMDHVALRNLKVKDLRTTGRHGAGMSWNEDLIKYVLVEESVNAILAQPICRSQASDEVYWLHNSDGIYSVKSGYGTLFGDYMERQGTCKDKDRISDVGRRLWASSDLGIRTDYDSFLSIRTWVIDWVSYLENLEGMKERQTQVVSTAVRAIDVDKKGSCNNAGIRESNPVCVVGMIRYCDIVRVMVDAGWKGNNNAGIGWIAMSGSGERLFWSSRRIRAETALQAEGLGVYLVLLWSRERGIRHLEISSDCLSLVRQLARMEKPHHLLKAIFDDIYACFSFFHCLAFSFIPRSFNTVVHSLACKAMADNGRNGYLDYREFVAVTIHLQKIENDEHFQKAFLYFDQDRSCDIELDELRDVCLIKRSCDIELDELRDVWLTNQGGLIRSFSSDYA